MTIATPVMLSRQQRRAKHLQRLSALGSQLLYDSHQAQRAIAVMPYDVRQRLTGCSVLQSTSDLVAILSRTFVYSQDLLPEIQAEALKEKLFQAAERIDEQASVWRGYKYVFSIEFFKSIHYSQYLITLATQILLNNYAYLPATFRQSLLSRLYPDLAYEVITPHHTFIALSKLSIALQDLQEASVSIPLLAEEESQL